MSVILVFECEGTSRLYSCFMCRTRHLCHILRPGLVSFFLISLCLDYLRVVVFFEGFYLDARVCGHGSVESYMYSETDAMRCCKFCHIRMQCVRQNGHPNCPLPLSSTRPITMRCVCTCRVSGPFRQDPKLTRLVLTPPADLGLETALDGVDRSS